MQHFVKDDHMNIFRLPVGWQYLVNNKLGGNLDKTNFGKYDQLVQACLQTGATCVIDVSRIRYIPREESRKLTYLARSTTMPVGTARSSAKAVHPTTSSPISGSSWPRSMPTSPSSSSP